MSFDTHTGNAETAATITLDDAAAALRTYLEYNDINHLVVIGGDGKNSRLNFIKSETDQTITAHLELSKNTFTLYINFHVLVSADLTKLAAIYAATFADKNR